MLKTRILTDSEPLDSIQEGAETLYKAVSVTMGPRGNNVIFRKNGKKVGVTHDGVTVAKMVKLNDGAEDVGADLLREAAMKMDATTGDGTTTVTVLAYNILKEAIDEIESGASPMKLRLAIEALEPQILDEINKYTDKNVTKEKLLQIATVAAGSEDIGNTVGEVVFDAGSETPIMLGFSEGTKTYSEVVKGFKISSGPASPYLMEGHGLRQTIENPYIMVVDASIRDKEDILPILSILAQVPQEDRKALLVCSDISGDALSLLVVNNLKGFAEIAVARVPGNVERKAEYLLDVAVSSGANVMSRNTGHSLLTPEIESFGRSKKVIIEPVSTLIVEGEPDPEVLKNHTEDLKDFEESAKSKAAREFASSRLKTLEQRVISVFVGGQSETDAEERHYRFEDAIGASQAALRGGVVPGGGTLFYSISEKLGDSIEANILSRALKAPLEKVLENAGIPLAFEPAAIKPGIGVNVMRPEKGITDLNEEGILDPAQSEIECIKTAITIAGLLMTSGAMIIDEGEDDAQA